MSNVASLENCKRLYELSGCDGTEFVYLMDLPTPYFANNLIKKELEQSSPAYSAGYLLRQLPLSIPGQHDLDTSFKHLMLHPSDNGRWTAYYTNSIFLEEQGSPEDALCLLAIKLAEEGVLTK